MAKDKKEPKEKVFTEDEISNHNQESDCWLIIGGNVYDVTKYLDDHPGGSEVLMEFAGGDGTTMFEDVGHSSEARSAMKEYLIGSVKGGGSSGSASGTQTKTATKEVKAEGGLSPVAVVFLLIAIAVGVYVTQQK